MPTPDRNTIRALLEALTANLRDNLVAQPPTVDRPFRSVAVGPVEAESYPRPFVSLALSRMRPITGVDGDRVFEVTTTLRIEVDVLAADPHPTLLDLIGAVEDCLDSLTDAGLPEGASGLDDRVWTCEHPRTTAGARAAAASANQTFTVIVERNHNRMPAA
jgi:hypothetical protein